MYTKDQTQLRHSFLSYLLLRHSQLKISYSEKLLSPPISSPRESYAFFRSIWDKQLINVQEQAYILYLNNGNEVICWRCLNTGTGNQSLFDVKLALACGLACLATNIIIAHNHPTGTLHASSADINMTKRLSSAAALMEIKLLDHVIISQKGYFSFSEHSLL